MTMKILLAVDGSDVALRAVDHLIGHVSWFREMPEIHLLHVQPPIPVGRALAHVSKETLHDHYLEESREHLREAQQKLDAAGRFHTTHVHVGQAAEVIAKVAGELGWSSREPSISSSMFLPLSSPYLCFSMNFRTSK